MLQKAIKSEVNNLLDEPTKLLRKKILEGKGTSQDLYNYAKSVASSLKEGTINQLMLKYELPEAVIEEAFGTEIMSTLMTNYHGKLIDLSALKVESDLKKKYLNLNAIRTEATKTRVIDIVAKLDECTTVNDVLDYLSGERLDHFYQSSLDEFCQENATFQYEAGLTLTLVRTLVGKSCPWCESLAGVYEYDGTPECGTGENLFARHTGCDCIIDVRTSRGSFERVRNYRRR